MQKNYLSLSILVLEKKLHEKLRSQPSTGGLERTGKERTGKRWKEPENFLPADEIGKIRKNFC